MLMHLTERMFVQYKYLSHAVGWCALHLRIILNKLTARVVFRCMSTQINGMEVYHTSMNKYIYRVIFVLLYYDNNYAQI